MRGFATLIFDFDGVIVDSMELKANAFRSLFPTHDSQHVEALVRYHFEHGGKSRFVKIRYFYEQILGVSVDESQVMELANQFSTFVRRELVDPKYLIEDTVAFLRSNVGRLRFHLVSGSEEQELKFLATAYGIDGLFDSIRGSPVPKTNHVRNILSTVAQSSETALIGDSLDDLEAASENGIAFFGYNNQALRGKGSAYIEQFSDIGGLVS